MIPAPRHLVLDLLLAADGQALSAREAIAACRLFGHRQSSVRVALARLSSEGLIEGTERGWYQLSARAHELANDVATWRSAEQRTRPWDGESHVLIHLSGRAAGDRRGRRQRQRALDMLGFRPLEDRLQVRPDNLTESPTALRQRLTSLGLDDDAIVCVARNFAPPVTARIAQLWDTEALNRRYRELHDTLSAWLQRAGKLDPEVAAREAFLLGSEGIRQIVFDPRLPAQMVDVDARQALVTTVHQFDRIGHGIWRAWIECQCPDTP